MASQRRPPGGTSLLTTLTVNPSLVRGRGVPISASSGLAVITLISPPARFLAPRSGSLSDLKDAPRWDAKRASTWGKLYMTSLSVTYMTTRTTPRLAGGVYDARSRNRRTDYNT